MIDFLINWFAANEEALRGWAVAGGTLILAIVAYLQVRASNRQIEVSKFQRRIEKHNEDLKSLFNHWWKHLPQVPSTGFEIYSHPILDFEENPLFSDLKNHLPAKYRNIMEKWELYKDLNQKYCHKQNEIINKIKILISEMQKEDLDYKFNPVPVYLKIIELIKEIEYYHLEKERVDNEHPYYLLYYVKIGDGTRYPLSSENLHPSKEIADSIIIRHEEISNIAKSEYKNEIKDIIDIESEMQKIFKELKDNIRTLTVYPEYNNMTCEYILFNN